MPWPPGSKPRQRDYFASTKAPVLGRSRLTEEGEVLAERWTHQLLLIELSSLHTSTSSIH